MLRSFKTLSISLGLLSFALVPACYGDEASSTTVETKTPVGDASTKIETKSDALQAKHKVKSVNTPHGSQPKVTDETSELPVTARPLRSKKKAKSPLPKWLA